MNGWENTYRILYDNTPTYLSYLNWSITVPIYFTGLGPKRRPPLVESQEVMKKLQHTQVLQGLAQYSAEIHGDVLRSYYEEPIKRNDSVVSSSRNQTKTMKTIKKHEIPSSFCIDPDNQKLLVCPRVELNKGTTVFKCCPFGKQLKAPLKDPMFAGNASFIFHCWLSTITS